MLARFLRILTPKRGENLNILLLIDALDVGGAETHVITLACGLQAAGHVVGVVSSGGCLEGRLTERGIPVWHFPAPMGGAAFGLSLLRHVCFLRRLQIRYGFDILHAHTRRTAMILRAYRMCERLVPSRSRLENGRPLPYRRRALRRLKAPPLIVTAHAKFAPRYRRLSYWGDATIAVSRDLKSHVAQAFFVPSEHISVIPNGIDEAVFFPPTVPNEGEHPTMSVVFASRLDKDCSAAAEALIELAPTLARAARERGKRLTVTLLGGGEKYQDISRLAALVNARQGEREPLIRAVGAVESPADYLRSADIFVGVSRAALEAAFCGCPVILAGNEGYGGLLTEQNFDAMAEQNFCCRGQKILSGKELEAALYHAVLSLSDMEKEQKKALADAIARRACNEYGAPCMCRETARLYRRALAEKRGLDVLVGGYAGCGNLGDDAILRCILRRWHQRAAPVSLAVSCGEAIAPEATLSVTALTGGQADFGIPCVERSRWFSVFCAMRRTDAFVLGGGALLQNCSSHGGRSLAYYLALMCLARLCGCPISLVANGIGPLSGRLSRAAVGAVLRLSREISVRDTASQELLCRMGFAPSIEPDPVLSIRPDRDAARWLLSLRGIPMPYVCIVPRPAKPDALRELTEAVQRLWQERGIYPLFFAFDRQRDTPICRDVMAACGVGAMVCCERERTVAGLFALSRGVISMRLHGLILAKVAKAPAICLPYSHADEKTVNFAKSAKQGVAGEDENGPRLWEQAKSLLKINES